MSSVPGFPCPDCRNRIVITMEALLAGAPVFCQSCGLELTVDPDRSAGALETVRSLKQKLDNDPPA